MQVSRFRNLLDVYPSELRFPFHPKELIDCPLTLANRTGHFIGVWITPTDQDTPSHLRFPNVEWECQIGDDGFRPRGFYILEPHSTFTMFASVKQGQEQPCPPSDTGKFELLMIIGRSERDLEDLRSYIIGNKLNMDQEIFKEIKDLKGEMHRAMLGAVICDPASCPELVRMHKVNLP